MAKIKIENLSYAYNKTDFAVNGISLEIKSQEWISIIGHNGSGKSTLAKLLVGLLKANEGSIFVDNLELNESNLKEIRKKVGIVFQNPDNQFVGVTVEHDIAFGLENRCIERATMQKLVKEYAEKVDVQEYLKKEPNFLSGGQKQRVAIAGILACNPDIIIFDEATSMLDPEGVKSVVNLIKNLKKENNKTLITITHDLEFASLSDRIIVLNEGKIILDDIPSKVFENEKALIEARVNIPFSLEVYNAIKKDESLNKNERLVNLLWEFNLRK